MDTESNVVEIRFFRPMACTTTVRFEDRTGGISRFVEKYSGLEKCRAELEKKCGVATGWRRKLLLWKIRRVDGRMLRMDAFRWIVALRALEDAIERRFRIAVEQFDYTFRYKEQGEDEDLLKAARSAILVWLYIWPPIDLLTHKTEPIGRMAISSR
jgi:hypothetical protein